MMNNLEFLVSDSLKLFLHTQKNPEPRIQD